MKPILAMILAISASGSVSAAEITPVTSYDLSVQKMPVVSVSVSVTPLSVRCFFIVDPFGNKHFICI